LNNIFYVANKGANTQLFFFNESSANPEMQPLEGFTCKEPQTYMYFMPSSSVNYWNKELDRAIRLTKNYVEHVAFRLPLKTEDFQADLYPPHPSS
jgi:coronin-1B/1C/6